MTSIDSYIGELKALINDCDPATRQDALADAEEHLRNALQTAISQSPETSREVLLADIIAQYGSPQETADAYSEIETRIQPMIGNQATRSTKNRSAFVRFFGIFADPRAWGALLYLLLSLVTGVIYFSWTITGLATSVGVSLLIIGLPVTVLFLLSFRGLALIEGRLVEGLLGVRMPRRQKFVNPQMSIWQKVKALFTSKTTWLDVLYMILMLPLGVIYFTVFVTLIAIGFAFLAAPIQELIFNQATINFGNQAYHMPLWSMPLSNIAGILFTTLTLHFAKWVGKIHGYLAKALLVSE